MKSIYSILILVLLVSLPIELPAATPQVEGTEQFVKKWVKSFGGRDATALGEMVDESDGTLIVLATGERLRSKEDYMGAQGAVFSGMDGLTVQLVWQEFNTLDERTVWGRSTLKRRLTMATKPSASAWCRA